MIIEIVIFPMKPWWFYVSFDVSPPETPGKAEAEAVGVEGDEESDMEVKEARWLITSHGIFHRKNHGMKWENWGKIWDFL